MGIIKDSATEEDDDYNEDYEEDDFDDEEEDNFKVHFSIPNNTTLYRKQQQNLQSN